ncbi:hypothetical protein [Wolbachia endosymbiont of Folsomia candida]|uniref:hypothetical protein n=1 Tax=Wolbachia endosymbiont of Folsomia candida TaxID=169402 RepID=UPI000AA1FAF0|nr:hypothetical protein [Wolbachia endosymbiont of Folsomia candida]APR97927.1 hypothetical protein ASM33_01175 [Wolbachia endosymbiont of Folsomia candida]
MDSGANDDKKPQIVEKPQKKPEGVIMSDDSGSPILVVPKCWIEGLEYFENPKTSGEYLVYIQIGNDAYRITGSNKYSTTMHVYTHSDKRFKMPSEYTFHINSVLKRGDNNEYEEAKVVSSNKAMADMFDLLRTQNVNVTRISGVALHTQAKANESGLTFMIHNGNLILRASEDCKCQLRTMLHNPEDHTEYLACVKRGENVYRVTGNKHCIQMGREYGFVVNSVLKRCDDGKFNENEVVDPVANMSAVRDMLDLNDKTTEGNITNIFGVEATPETELTATPTTTGEPEVKPGMTKVQQEAVGNAHNKQ